MQAWLRGHARLSPSAAARLVSNGRALEQLPAVAVAFSEGAVTADQVAVIAPVASADALVAAAEQGDDLGEIGGALADVAAPQPHQRLGEVVHRYLEALDPDGPEPDPTEGRSLTPSRHSDGSLGIRGQLDAVGRGGAAGGTGVDRAGRPPGR